MGNRIFKKRLADPEDQWQWGITGSGKNEVFYALTTEVTLFDKRHMILPERIFAAGR